MSSYNKVQRELLRPQRLPAQSGVKKQVGFDGFVMSDFGSGVRDTVEAANGGQNIEMSGTTYFGDKLIRAVREGQVSESTIDDAVLRIIRTMISFRDAGNGKYPDSVIGCKEHISLALQSAREGITLILKQGQSSSSGQETDEKTCRHRETCHSGKSRRSRIQSRYSRIYCNSA